MLHLYNEVIYRPILNTLVLLYNIIPGHDVGLAIIVVTFLIRLILAPFMHKSLKSQQMMNALQPKLNDVREKHKGDKEQQAKAIMGLYKEHKINPLASCLPLIIQLPILIALYQVLAKALKGNLEGLYHFIHNPGLLNPKMFGIIDLSQPNFLFAIAAGLAQFWQSKMMTASNTPSTDPTAKMMNVQVTYILPLISVFIAWRLPAGLPLYWTVTTLLLVAQQKYISKADIIPGVTVIEAEVKK